MSAVLITGAGGHVGRALTAHLARQRVPVIATDLTAPADLPRGVRFERLDVTGSDPDRVIGTHRPDVVIHLASVVTPPPGFTDAMAYRVDVTGSRHVLDACLRHGVRRLVVTSSGAAYGYHPENLRGPLAEDAPLRGNRSFAYAWHKRLVEEMLADARADHPALKQVVLRVGTVLGAGLENQITALFHKPRPLMLTGSDSPFVFIWDQDLAAILARAAQDGPPGIYNVAGDGAPGMVELARHMGKSVRQLPPGLLRAALTLAHPLGLSRYGPQQIGFLQYRPVLDNTALKTVFGYSPGLTSIAAFDRWWQAAQ
ncbi:MAG: NAD-dependent epimerase/dehydratase family protein [Pararhodobacter sp.]